MMLGQAVFLGLLVCGLGAPSGDEILSLPGLMSKPSFKQYSGYINATGTRRLHYWFVESQNNPSTDPVVMWTNGGPGCSSMEGFLNEHGPFMVNSDGATLRINPYSWNTVSSMLYIEAPAGVGYSYSQDKNYATNDDQVSLDTYTALKHFFQMYPEFKKNEFYVSGESYGGIYVPTLAVRVADDSSFNFKGIVVGNGFSDADMNENSILQFAYFHGLYGKEIWFSLVQHCCDGNATNCDFLAGVKKSAACADVCGIAQSKIYSIGINEYNMYADCVQTSLYDESKYVVYGDRDLLFNRFKAKKLEMLKSIPLEKLREVPPCVDAKPLHTYVNNPKVRAALHIPNFLPEWQICSAAVGMKYKRLYNSMKQQYLKLLANKNYNLLVYNGDIDMACNFLGDEMFVDGLGQKLISEYTPWHIQNKAGNQVAGFVKHYENLTFVTVRGAGHMVPQDKPAASLKMFKAFLQGHKLQ